MAFLIGPLAVSLIAAFLAALIVVVDRVVNNYGEVNIDINGKKSLKVKGGQSLLAALASQGVFVPSACGGRGSCGACKLTLKSDVGPILPTETAYLSESEQAASVRLACQIKLKKNLSIELPESLFAVRKVRAVVEALRDLTHDIKELRLRLADDEAEVRFEPGQYIQLSVPPYGKIKQSTQRAYSISSKPSDKRHLELIIRLVAGGIATTWVHRFLKKDDAVTLVGPFGDFGVRATDAAMICVAGGSGMAPFKSILEYLAETGAHEAKEIWYFFGARSKQDLFYLDEMAALEKKMSRFHFVPALSEPKEDDKWTGATGLITEVLASYLRENIKRDMPKEGYLCGSPGMIDACVKVMTADGIGEDAIFYDKFA